MSLITPDPVSVPIKVTEILAPSCSTGYSLEGLNISVLVLASSIPSIGFSETELLTITVSFVTVELSIGASNSIQIGDFGSSENVCRSG